MGGKIWLILFLSISDVLCEYDVDISLTYPFGYASYESRQDSILDDLRRDMHIDYKRENLNPAMLLSDPLTDEDFHVIRNLESLEFLLQRNPKPSSNDADSTGLIYDESELHDLLRDSCGHIVKGYWAFVWCHRKDIRQVRVDRTVNHVGDPDLHLGTYERSVAWRSEFESADEVKPIVKV